MCLTMARAFLIGVPILSSPFAHFNSMLFAILELVLFQIFPDSLCSPLDTWMPAGESARDVSHSISSVCLVWTARSSLFRCLGSLDHTKGPSYVYVNYGNSGLKVIIRRTHGAFRYRPYRGQRCLGEALRLLLRITRASLLKHP
jgi:hypothetical protein